MAIKTVKPENPFFTNANIPDKFFCGRNDETEKILALLQNGNNVVLAAERRVGKSTLIRHILNMNEIKKKYNTLYVDINGTSSAEAFINAMNEAFKDPTLSTFPQKFSREITEISKEYNSKIELNFRPLHAEGSYRKTEKIQVDNTINEIFKKLASTSRKNLIVFDEFQQIEEYRDNITALLRSRIQMMNNTSFIFSGSSVHMLSSMFMNYNQPFYDSSSMIGLKRIPEDTYIEFCIRMFRLYGKDVAPEVVSTVYHLSRANFLTMQKVMNRTFSLTPIKETANKETVKLALKDIVESCEDI